MDDSPFAKTTVAVERRHIDYAQILYGLQALAVLLALLHSVSIANRFVFSLPSVVAVIMNYARRNQVRGTWLESHFSWQLRSFWTAAIILVCAWPLVLTILLIPLVMALYGAVGLWVVYRVVRGWLALREGRIVPDSWF